MLRCDRVVKAVETTAGTGIDVVVENGLLEAGMVAILLGAETFVLREGDVEGDVDVDVDGRKLDSMEDEAVTVFAGRVVVVIGSYKSGVKDNFRDNCSTELFKISISEFTEGAWEGQF